MGPVGTSKRGESGPRSRSAGEGGLVGVEVTLTQGSGKLGH